MWSPIRSFCRVTANPYRTSVTLPMIRRTMRGWLYTYLGSRGMEVQPRLLLGLR
jgi:hypothetical protein